MYRCLNYKSHLSKDLSLYFLFQACLVLLVVALTTGVFSFPTEHGTDGEIRESNEGQLRMRRNTNIKTRKYIHCLNLTAKYLSSYPCIDKKSIFLTDVALPV